jgi:hypothetical protein
MPIIGSHVKPDIKAVAHQNEEIETILEGRNLYVKSLFNLVVSVAWILMVIVPISSKAQLELYGKFDTDGSVEPIINYNGSMKISEKFAVTFFGLVRQKWSQALIGVSYLPIPNVSLSASAGIEQGQHSPRYSASIWIKSRQNTFLALGELGAGYQNYLYKVNIFHQFTENISLGVMDWRYHGLGPNFRYTIPKLKSMLWIMPAYDHEQDVIRCMAGVSLLM